MNKILRVSSIAAPLLLTTGTVGTYLIVASKKTSVIDKSNNRNLSHENNPPTKNIFNDFDVFPKLDQHDFYNHIRINDVDDYEDGENKQQKKIEINGMKVVIDNEMQAKIINYVLRHMKTTDGEIYYGIERINSYHIKFHFKWNRTQDDAYYKTYDFLLSYTKPK